MHRDSERFDRIRGLSETDLIDLKAEAEKLTRKKLRPPSFDEIKQGNARRGSYPLVLQIITLVLVAVVLIVAGILSAIHVTAATGSWLYFVLAEPAILVGALSWTVLFRNNWVGKLLIATTVLVALAIAFVGNYVSRDVTSLIHLLMVIAPPLFTVAMAIVLERFFMTSIQTNVEAAHEFKRQSADYQQIIDNLESTQEYRNTFANLIWETLLKQNNRGRYATEMRQMLISLPLAERRQLVRREMNRLQWYTAGVDHDETVTAVTANRANGRQLIHSPAFDGNGKPLPNGGSGDSIACIEPSYRPDGILGVRVTERPPTQATVAERKHLLSQHASAHPDLFDIQSRDELAAWYGVSTGTVSNLKREIIVNGKAQVNFG